MRRTATTPRGGVLSLLARDDKWYLGGGNRLLWAPAFPLWLDAPGAWDAAHYYNIEHGPLFTWTILDEEGREIALRFRSRRWDPSVLVTQFDAADGSLRVTERKSLLACDALGSLVELTERRGRRRRLHFVAWSAPWSAPGDGREWIDGLRAAPSGITFRRHVASASRPEFSYGCAFGLDVEADSHAVQLSEGSRPHPRWALTPFVAKFRQGRLPGSVRLGGVTPDGVVFMALHAVMPLPARGRAARTVYLGAAPSPAGARASLRQARALGDVAKASAQAWNDYFASVPSFTCSEERFTRYYWYRWYGLRLLTTQGGELHYRHPSVSEGIGYFRAPISYSAFCHMLENRWRHDPALARGSLLTFAANARPDGAFRGYIDPDYYRRDALGEPFYHADWGRAVEALQAVHPDAGYLRAVYAPLAAYARYFDRDRDTERSGLYDIDNHYETGQEYMHRYLAVDAKADRDNWGEVFRLKGVDVTVYLYTLKRALGRLARAIGRPPAEARSWDQGADATKRAVLARMWDPKAGMFFDVDPKTRRRTMVKAATCFYPYLTDIVDERHTAGLVRHLLNPREFWTPFPVPASSLDDAYFSAEPEWKGKRMNCPWNGRVWPMTNSHMADVLAATARRTRDARIERAAAEFLERFITMLSFDGDPARPNCFEHYHPMSGEPSVYRGVDDYQHSWVNDLLLRYVAGVEPSEGAVVIDPLPMGCERVGLDGAWVAGRLLRLRKEGARWRVWIDGELRHDGRIPRGGVRIAF